MTGSQKRRDLVQQLVAMRLEDLEITYDHI